MTNESEAEAEAEDEYEYVVFNFKWTKKMRREVETMSRQDGSRTKVAFVRKAIQERLDRAQNSDSRSVKDR